MTKEEAIKLDCNRLKRYHDYVEFWIMKKEREKTMKIELPKIKKVIFNNPATIVFWTDGSKTVVKCSESIWDPEKGLAMAISKKFLGNKGKYFNEFKKWIK